MTLRTTTGSADPEKSRVRFFVGLAIFLAITAGLFFIDEPVYRFVHENYNINTRPVPWYLKIPTRVLRSMEDWGENVYILCVLIAIWKLDRTRRSRVACLIAAALMVTLCVEGIKRVTGRERPEVSKGQFVFHGPSVWGEGGDFQSFPSGHTASGASFSGSLAAFYPPMRPVAIALAVGCASNRVWKERHFLSDCFVAGVFGFWFAATLPRRRWFKPFLTWFDARFSDPPEPVATPSPMARAA
jgi:membrane-associated phospholipid phosphatase